MLANANTVFLIVLLQMKPRGYGKLLLVWLQTSHSIAILISVRADSHAIKTQNNNSVMAPPY